ncbi:hematopoietic prostaglandin D synthase-like isoform X2 [Procambarus clarkii]
MPEYKLVYFNTAGRAELVRWIFAYGGIPFTDERIEKEDWPERKKTTEGGKLPVLIVDGKTLPQSLAIARFAAKKAGLVPEDDLEAAFCDALADTAFELLMEAHSIWHGGSPDKSDEQKQLKDNYFSNNIDPFMTRLEKRLSEKQWFVSDKITWADLVLCLFYGAIRREEAERAGKFPALLAHVNKVKELPQIKEWLSSHPVTSATTH